MTSPIPLTSPEGVIFAYACATCHGVGSTWQLTEVATPEHIAESAEKSREDAAGCCLCDRCKGPLPGPFPRTCQGCESAEKAERAEREAAWAKQRAEEEAVKSAALARSPNPKAAEMLGALMSDTSEDCWCSGWEGGTEYALWEIVQGGSRQWGMSEVDEKTVARLRSLSEKAGGWVRWERPVGEVFVPMAEWLPLYEAHVAEVKARAEAREERDDG